MSYYRVITYGGDYWETVEEEPKGGCVHDNWAIFRNFRMEFYPWPTDDPHDDVSHWLPLPPLGEEP
jgi:hypothetical protein